MEWNVWNGPSTAPDIQQVLIQQTSVAPFYDIVIIIVVITIVTPEY